MVDLFFIFLDEFSSLLCVSLESWFVDELGNVTMAVAVGVETCKLTLKGSLKHVWMYVLGNKEEKGERGFEFYDTTFFLLFFSLSQSVHSVSCTIWCVLFAYYGATREFSCMVDHTNFHWLILRWCAGLDFMQAIRINHERAA